MANLKRFISSLKRFNTEGWWYSTLSKRDQSPRHSKDDHQIEDPGIFAAPNVAGLKHGHPLSGAVTRKTSDNTFEPKLDPISSACIVKWSRYARISGQEDQVLEPFLSLLATTNSAQPRQSRPDFSLVLSHLQVKVVNKIDGVPSLDPFFKLAL